ncbi:amino acid permease C-terminal domain-containing protein [Pseudomonas sp. RC2C2]|uniref:amino acid permease C-terminal domain-containing protein n=1 Tax=Pseudomonas sp. RC2C2 TaxID=2834408 RepID=UPI0032DE578A
MLRLDGCAWRQSRSCLQFSDTSFCLVSIAVIVLRIRRPDLKRAFRCPWVPFVPLAAIASCATLMAYLSWHTWLAFGGWISLGVLLYFSYARTNSKLTLARTN